MPRLAAFAQTASRQAVFSHQPGGQKADKAETLAPTPPPADNGGLQIIRDAVARLADLESLNRARGTIRERRRRLSELRSRFQAAQRDLSAKRQNWCAVLKQLGLSETVKIGETLATWARLAEAREQLLAWKAAQTAASQLTRCQQSFCARMEEAGRRAGKPVGANQSPLDVLAAWQAELKTLDNIREER